ncbi:hypothetical protein KL918_005293 [Ogataea parapolymorpha]|uniref:Uncharacterized protein n=1 Tax=Ogataea parapolymorpha (strain ATCC 26012 / BCRC 20466 / JCM 22074 / NRRL Y-7560 / DL-1) TaxID=871575 RepID=W1QHS1_OGAPD|nr:hypothetical protein HPODL_04668 [Ogataea parapolymorpha DL-1]ESX01900.1 hypothetical protein HPODL_04668 [Ogataea parapolymorpha DL-1]KAG7864654.1 hypothetical protein KL918_005293 [Ogataea parapolymorpha]KAG7869729.1 hypothetical protein KL916_005198 [Ogataea parapolymorpha]
MNGASSGPSQSPRSLKQQRFCVSPRQIRSPGGEGAAREISFGRSTGDSEGSSDEDIFNVRKKAKTERKTTPKSIKETNSITSLLSTAVQARSKDKLSKDLGFDLDSALKVTSISRKHEKVMQLRREEDEIDRMVEKSEAELRQQQQAAQELDKQILARVDPSQKSYIEHLRERMLNGDAAVTDVCFLDKPGLYGKTSTTRLELLPETLLGEGRWYLDRKTLSLDVITDFMQLSATSVWRMLQTDLSNEIVADEGLIRDFMLADGMVGHRAEFKIESKKSFPHVTTQVMKLQFLLSLVRSSKTKTAGLPELRAFVTIVVRLLVDSRVNEPNVDDYICLGQGSVHAIQLLNEMLVSLGQWYFELFERPFSELAREWVRLVCDIVDNELGAHVTLVHRLICNVQQLTVPILRYLKLWLIFKFLIEKTANDESKLDSAGLQGLSRQLLTYAFEKEDMVAALYHFTRIFSQCSLKLAAETRTSPTLQDTLARLKLYQMAVFMTLGWLKTSLLNKRLGFSLNEATYYSTDYYERLQLDLSGVPENEYLLHHIKFYINMVKNRYFRNYSGAILPTVTECVAVLTNVLARIERELTMPEIFTD